MDKTSHIKNWSVIILAAAMTLSCGGGDAIIEPSRGTQGQQLLDLKKAYDEGIITKDEYEDAKEEILDD